MNIIYIADIHGDFTRVKELLAATDAQVYIIAGDLIDRPFFTQEMAARYRTLQTSLSRLLYKLGDQAMDMDDFVEGLLKRKDLPREVLKEAGEYRESTLRARRVLQQKYKVLESILSLKQNSQVFCLPGNYDMDLQYTSLHGRDLHRHWYHVAELRIAGYGGADVATPGIPQRYSVPYRADRGSREMTRFFTETRPDIIVTHKPAHGVHDHVPPMGESGSTELRAYCEENRVPLCLTGHIHDQWGFQELDGTIYLNPSNFGAVPQPGGQMAEGGFFYSIGTRENRVDRVVLGKLVDGKVHDVVRFVPGKGSWKKTVLDAERFGALVRGKNHERKKDQASMREEISARMSWFFPGGNLQDIPLEEFEELKGVALQFQERHGVYVDMDIFAGGSPSPAAPGIEVVLYVGRGRMKTENLSEPGDEPCVSPEMWALLKEGFGKCPHVRVVDCIDLDRVARAARERDYECDAALLFAAYRVYGTALEKWPRADGEAAILERQLDADRVYRGEIEGTGCAYMEIFQNVAARVENMKIFDARLRELGIATPDAYKRRIRELLDGPDKTKG